MNMQVVTLTTDFGNQDYYVAELKGALLSIAGQVELVDVSHSISSYDIVQASFYVQNIYNKFPLGTIHIVAVHHYYSRKNRILVFKRDGHFFVAPDNGVASLLFEDLKIGEIFTIDESELQFDTIVDIYAHVVGYIKHNLPVEEIGPRVDSINKKLQLEPVITDNQIRATIMHVDHYDNVIVNLKKEEFEQIRNGRKFELYYKQNEPIDHISRMYSDVVVGEVLCMFNSDGYLEIAINMGKASSMLNLFRNETIQINFY